MRIHRQNYHDIERIIEFDFVRATEAAALNSLPWLGRGEKEKADAAACDALRTRLSAYSGHEGPSFRLMPDQDSG